MTRRRRLDAAAPERNIFGCFSWWYHWKDRRGIPDGYEGFVHHYGGVYLLAHFREGTPPNAADPLSDRVIYIGEGSHLGRRWAQFERSARRGSLGHSGGHTYRSWAKRNKVAWNTLYVAALPIWFSSEGSTNESQSLARRFRLYLEQRLLFDLVVHRKSRTGLHLLNVK